MDNKTAMEITRKVREKNVSLEEITSLATEKEFNEAVDKILEEDKKAEEAFYKEPKILVKYTKIY